jgi:hypothetical protein
VLSNLGRYEDIVVWAKESGGVDELLAKIRADAVTESTPGRVGIGLTVGIALTLAGVAALDRYKKTWAVGREAEDRLRDTIAEADQSVSTDATLPRPDTEPANFGTIPVRPGLTRSSPTWL